MTPLTLRGRVALLLLLALGFVARAASPLLWPNITNADEVYQTVEQGYRLLTDRGFIPWEYYYGIRSWLFPGLLGGLIRIGWTLGLDGPQTFIFLRLVMVAASTPIIACAYFWGRRSGLPGAGILAGLLAALWPDLVLFSSHPLNDTAGAALLIPGVFLAEPAPGGRMSWLRAASAAFLLSMAVMLRVQLGPAAVFAWAWLVWPAWRARLVPAVVGGALPVLIAGIVDWISWGRPLQSLWLNAIVNWSYGAASTFGTSPWFAYIGKIDVMWGGATALVALAAVLGSPRARLVAWVVALLLLSHMAIGHKEYRFILPAIPLILVLAGIGTARALAIAARGLNGKVLVPILGALLLWAGTAASLMVSREYLDLFRKQTGVVAASFEVARLPKPCGIGIWGLDWLDLAGEFSFGHTVPVFYADSQEEFTSRAPGFDVLLYPDGKLPDGIGWDTLSCRPMNGKLPDFLAHPEPVERICVAIRRGGGCTAEPPLVPPLFVPRELKDKPYPWLARPLPDRIVTWGKGG